MGIKRKVLLELDRLGHWLYADPYERKRLNSQEREGITDTVGEVEGLP